MSKLSIVTAKQLAKIIESQGFVKMRQTGSHARYKSNDNRVTVIPMHSGDLPRGTIRDIIAQVVER